MRLYLSVLERFESTLLGICNYMVDESISLILSSLIIGRKAVYGILSMHSQKYISCVSILRWSFELRIQVSVPYKKNTKTKHFISRIFVLIGDSSVLPNLIHLPHSRFCDVTAPSDFIFVPSNIGHSRTQVNIAKCHFIVGNV